MRDFRKLEVYQESLSLVIKVYNLTKDFPNSELYGLTQQIRRCAVSIPSNLAEGSSRDSSKEFSRFIQISLGSAFELETQFKIAEQLNYVSSEPILNQLNKLQKRLNALNKSIK